MAKKRRRYKDTSLTPAIVALNILIVLVMGLLVFFVYRYITTEQEIIPRAFAETSQPPEETTEELTITEAVTTTALSITKASTTTPVPGVEYDDAKPAYADLGYDENFFADDFFIGDSIMTGFTNFGYLPNNIVFAKIGLNPQSALTEIIDGKTAAERAAELLPNRIYVMLGTNGLSYMSCDYMVNEMGKLITELKSKSPGSIIVILTIPPVTEAHEQKNPEENIDKINLYNDLLKTLALENDCVVSDVNALLAGENGYMQVKYAEQDGLHFLNTAYKAVLSKLQNDSELQ